MAFCYNCSKEFCSVLNFRQHRMSFDVTNALPVSCKVDGSGTARGEVTGVDANLNPETKGYWLPVSFMSASTRPGSI